MYVSLSLAFFSVFEYVSVLACLYVRAGSYSSVLVLVVLVPVVLLWIVYFHVAVVT